MKIDLRRHLPDIRISPQEIHLWCAHDEEIADRNLLNSYRDILNRSESLQQKRFLFAKHRHQYLVTRVLVRSVLSFYQNAINPSDWEFGKNYYGRPYIENNNAHFHANFNISHTGKMVVLAVAISDKLGIDVENLSREIFDIKLSKNMFAEVEHENLCAITGQKKRTERFFELWTLKEAYIKAQGKGMSIPLNSFYFTFPAVGDVSVNFDQLDTEDPKLWKFWSLTINTDHRVSLAVKNNTPSTQLKVSVRNIVPLSYYEEVDFNVILESICNS